MIEVGFAAPDEADEITTLLRAVAAWSEAAGHLAWTTDLLQTQITTAKIIAGEQFCDRQAGRIVGAGRIEPEDPVYWPDRPSGEAFYLHRLAVARDVAGAGVADMMIQWALTQVGRTGRPLARLDCAPRPKLCALYERNGFRFVDERFAPFHVFRYERAV